MLRNRRRQGVQRATSACRPFGSGTWRKGSKQGRSKRTAVILTVTAPEDRPMPDDALTTPGDPTTGHTPPLPDALPDRAGRYLLREEVGRGGMGVVLRAEDPDLGRVLAVKVSQSALSDHGTAGRRFLDEARLTAQLQH